MLDGQAAVKLTEVLGWLREVSIIGGIAGIIWKARGSWDDVARFFERLVTHMSRMETFADMVINNHLLHIERDIAHLVRTEGFRDVRNQDRDTRNENRDARNEDRDDRNEAREIRREDRDDRGNT